MVTQHQFRQVLKHNAKLLTIHNSTSFLVLVLKCPLTSVLLDCFEVVTNVFLPGADSEGVQQCVLGH